MTPLPENLKTESNGEPETKNENLEKFVPMDRRAAWSEKTPYYYELLKKNIRFLVPKNKKILQMGLRNGELLSNLNPSRGLGIDSSEEIIGKAKNRYQDNKKLEFQVGDIEHLKVTECFDYVILADMVGHLKDIEETLSGIKKVCGSHTRIIISYYNFLWEPLLKLAEKLHLKMPQENQNWLSAKDLHHLLYLTGFTVVKTENRILLPIYIPWLSAFLNRFVSALPLFSALCLGFYIVARPSTEKHGEHEYSTTIVIPCRNECGNIEQAVLRIPPFGRCQEIIFIDGHSTDGTPDEIKRVIGMHPNRDIKFMVQDATGKGDAVRKAFSHATGDILMILDADLTVPPEDLPKFYHALADNKGEFVNGTRLVYPMEKEAMRFLNLVGNQFFSLMFSWLLNQRFKDTLCGTKVLFRRDYLQIEANRSYFGDFDPFGDFDLIFGASKLNLHIVEIPIRYRERTYGATNISRFKHGLILLKMCLFAFKKLKMLS